MVLLDCRSDMAGLEARVLGMPADILRQVRARLVDRAHVSSPAAAFRPTRLRPSGQRNVRGRGFVLREDIRQRRSVTQVSGEEPDVPSPHVATIIGITGAGVVSNLGGGARNAK